MPLDDPTETKWLCGISRVRSATTECAKDCSLFFPQACLAQALHMQLLHPLVAETVQLEECKRSVGLMLDELGDLGPRLVGAAKLGEGCGNILAGGIVQRTQNTAAACVEIIGAEPRGRGLSSDRAA
jgi:hypothetical protein